MAETKIGDIVWREVERHYRGPDFKPEDGFYPLTIVGETKFSWVAKEQPDGWVEFKFPKKKNPEDYSKDPNTRLAKFRRGSTARIYLTREAVEREVWLARNRNGLRVHFERLVNSSDIDTLKAAAAASGYQETP